MNRFTTLPLVICLLGATGFGPAIAPQPDTVVVENSQVRLVFATSPAPFLRELVEKTSGKNLLAEPADQNLFTIVVSQPQGGNATVESRSAKQGSITVDRSANRQHLVIQLVGLGPAGDMRVELKGALDKSSPDKKSIWRRHSYQFCPAAPGVKEFFRGVIDQTHALGVDILQMDQAALGYWSDDPCGSTSHGHEPGRGPYQVQAFRDLLDDMRKR